MLKKLFTFVLSVLLTISIIPIHAASIDAVHLQVENMPQVGRDPVSVNFMVDESMPYMIQDDLAMAWTVGENYYVSEPMVDQFEYGNVYYANVKVDMKDKTKNRFDEDLMNVIVDGVDEDDLVLYRIADDGSYVELVIAFKVEAVLSGTPVITGEPNVGECLAANTFHIDDQDGAFLYQWYQDDRKIEDATMYTYEVQKSDVGHEISVEVTSTKVSGQLRSKPVKIVQSEQSDEEESTVNSVPILLGIAAFVVVVIIGKRKLSN